MATQMSLGQELDKDNIMNKHDFIQKITSMRAPSIREFSPDDNNELLCTCWIVEDTENIHNKFCTPAVKLLYGDYLQGNLESFYVREKHYREMYHRWLESFLAQQELDK
jgi:hypothetical protein